MVDVVDCVPLDELAARYPALTGDAHAFRPFCWTLARPRRLAKLVPMSGKLGLYGSAPPAVASRIRELAHAGASPRPTNAGGASC